jgi:CheY-like chemotaxis protein
MIHPTADENFKRVSTLELPVGKLELGSHSAPLPRILLIDDDLTFGRILAKAAQRSHLELIECNSVKQVNRIPKWNFDVALIDYDLGDITGVQLSDVIGRLRDMPVLLLSQYKQITVRQWPSRIKGFLHKSAGPFVILQAAVDLHQASA